MFYSRFFCDFLAQMPKFAFRVVGCVFVIKSKHFRDFPDISLDPKSEVVWQLVRQLLHPLSGDNNVVPF